VKADSAECTERSMMPDACRADHTHSQMKVSRSRRQQLRQIIHSRGRHITASWLQDRPKQWEQWEHHSIKTVTGCRMLAGQQIGQLACKAPFILP
jgi:hypothetical protein